VDLVLEDGRLAVCRLDPMAPWPVPSPSSRFVSVTRTPDELSVVCAEGDEPVGARVAGGWRALRIIGPLPFDLVGVIASVTVPLAAASVGVFVLSTYDCDLVLVQEAQVDLAVATLVAAGHPVHTAPR
jgi:hypothetical protein